MFFLTACTLQHCGDQGQLEARPTLCVGFWPEDSVDLEASAVFGTRGAIDHVAYMYAYLMPVNWEDTR